MNPVSYLFHGVATQLSRAGVIDGTRGSRIAELTWPRFLTMFARQLYRVTDIAMVGIAVGPTAIAGLAIASIYFQLANAFSLGLAGGTISQVSQRFGANLDGQLDIAVKQALVIGLGLMIPFMIGYSSFAVPLIGLISSDAATTVQGAAYLQILSVALAFNVANQVFGRALAGANDTRIAMATRATGALVNVVLNAILIFGFGLGVQGAAIGTAIAEGVVTATLAWGFLTGSLPLLGPFPITVSVTGPYLDRDMATELAAISPPLIFDRFAKTFARYPLFAVLASFGPVTIAAYEVARRIRMLMESTSKGFTMAASGLVGQELGSGDELEAGRYGWDVLRFGTVIYVIAALLVSLFATPLSHFFVDDPENISHTVPFVRIAAVSFLATGLAQTLGGILMAAGDNRWILYGRLVSQYLVLVPVSFLGTVTPLGIGAVFAAVLAEAGTRASIIGYRFTSERWKITSRTRRPDAVND